VLILFLSRGHSEFHDRFADQVGVHQICGMRQFQQHLWTVSNLYLRGPVM
jgi:hypothetical protein